MNFNSKQCRTLHVLPKDLKGASMLRLAGGGKSCDKAASEYLTAFELEENTDYSLEYLECTESFAYIFSKERVLKEGIEIISSKCKGSKSANPYCEQYHFTPPIGWMNDPNGLCFHGGYYHMYYQFYPHAQQWGNMHWGHAVSEDLVHWRHMPVFLIPQKELISKPDFMGGAFSGSAVVDGDGIRYFFTRHIAPKADETLMIETQVTLKSIDGIAPEKEEIVVEKTNPDHLFHFRDPKVFTYGGKHYMVLGSAEKGVPSILLYSSENYIEWKYEGAVLEVHDKGCVTIECPDMFELDGKFVCAGAHMTQVDEDGRISPVYYYIGDFKGGKLTSASKGLYDFGGNFYAVQSFEAHGKRIAFGWIADFYNEHIEIPEGVCGSMTLPRELRVKNGKLYQKPVESVYSLLDKQLYKGTNGVELAVDGNCCYAKLMLGDHEDFRMILAQNGSDRLSLAKTGGRLTLTSTKAKVDLNCDICEGGISEVEIFLDRRLCEIFVNGGEAAFAKTFYSSDLKGVLKAEFSGKGSLEVYSVKGCGLNV